MKSDVPVRGRSAAELTSHPPFGLLKDLERPLLLGAWLVVAVDTARGSATGRLFKPTPPAEPAPQSS